MLLFSFFCTCVVFLTVFLHVDFGGFLACLLFSWRYTLQRKNAKNSKQIFPEMEYRALSPNFHIHVSVSELYVPTKELPFLLEEICGPILGIYKSLTDT